MEKVPVVNFCPPVHPPPPPPKAAEGISRAEARFSLATKCAVVTGGARGLGLTAAEGMLEHGLAKVALLDVDTEEGAKAVEYLRSSFSGKDTEIVFRTLDVTEGEALSQTIAQIAHDFGKIDILICFSGIVSSVRAVDYTPEAFRKILDVNTTGTFLTAQAVGREMIVRNTGGSIILTASMAGHIVNYPQTHVAYGTCKSAIHHMTHCLAAEWAEHGIRVNSLSPGYMDTRLNASENLTEVLPVWLERTPMGRMGRKEELVGPVVLLASEAGSFMTGSDLRVDAGYTLF